MIVVEELLRVEEETFSCLDKMVKLLWELSVRGNERRYEWKERKGERGLDQA